MTALPGDSIFFLRESKRAYLDKPVEQEKLDDLFEIIRWSPSCSNNQPWRFIFVRDDEQKKKAGEALPRGNQWATNAPILVAVCTHEDFDVQRDDDDVDYSQFDCGLGTMSLLLGAVQVGLMAHPMAGYDSPAMKKALGVPDDWKIMCMVSLGYRGNHDDLDEQTKEKDEGERTRKAVDEIIQFDKFNFRLPEKDS